MEKQLEVLKKALEMGATINVNLHRVPTLAEAENKAKELCELAGREFVFNTHGNKSQWYATEYSSKSINIAVFTEELIEGDEHEQTA
jgi:hypothetical protein